MPPRLSVVMPSYNQAPFIARAVESVLRQGMKDLELIVMDGGSKDDTVSILSEFARKDSRVRFISEPDRGQAHAVNKGIAQTTGDVIGWLNSDDLYYPGALSAVLQFLDNYPHIDVVYGDGDHVDENERILRRHPTEPWNKHRLEESVILSQPSTFFRRSVVAQCGVLDETLHFALDYEYWLRLSQKGMHFAYLPRVLSGTRMHDAAKTIDRRLAMHVEVNDMLKRRLGHVPDRWLLNYAFVAAGADTHLRLSTPLRALAVLPVAARASLKWNGKLRGASFLEWAQGIGEKASRVLERKRAA